MCRRREDWTGSSAGSLEKQLLSLEWDLISVRLAVQVIMLKSMVTEAPMKLNNALKRFSNNYLREG